MVSTLYAWAVRRRREWYAAHPARRRRLRRPVISVGNLAVGGRGKTPLAASLARMLQEMGERPAILSRGYARSRPERGVVIVRDPRGMRADLARAGDEPLMLARQLPGVSVLVCADRYLAGCVAETELDASVHILDDGFQHLQLDRDVDLVVLGREDVERPVTLPGGRLREPLDTLIAADAVLRSDDDVVVNVDGLDIPLFDLRRRAPPRPPDRAPILAVAGIASPERFFRDVRAAGWNVAATAGYRDHHAYTARDLAALGAAAARAGATGILTTEKDYVRLLPLRPFPLPIAYVPFALDPDPIDEFRGWLAARLRLTRGEPVV